MYAVAHPLRLGYMGLKKRLGGVPRLRPKAAKPAFVELMAPHPAAVGRKITDQEFAHVNLKPDKFHGEWNYTIHPRN